MFEVTFTHEDTGEERVFRFDLTDAERAEIEDESELIDYLHYVRADEILDDSGLGPKWSSRSVSSI